jgi:hypothetical protein
MNWRNPSLLLTHCVAGLFTLLVVGCCPQRGDSEHLLDAPPLAQNQRITGTYEDLSTDHQDSLWLLVNNQRSPSLDKLESQKAWVRLTDDGQGTVTAIRIIDGVEQRKHVLLKRVGGYAYVDHPGFFSCVLITSFGCVQAKAGVEPNGDLAVQTDAHIAAFMLILPVPADPIGVKASFHRVGD